MDGKIKIPDEYCLQLGLYLYLRNTIHGVFGVAFLEPQDYADPESFQAKDHDIQIVKCEMKRELIQPYIDYATQ
jgi:hypothetical protein